MIKLTLKSGASSADYQFDEGAVVIGGKGDGSRSMADLSLEDQGLDDHHCKLEWVDGKCIAINLANDPFTTINGSAFGKREVAAGDILEVGAYTITIQINSENDQGEIGANLSDLSSLSERDAGGCTTNSPAIDNQGDLLLRQLQQLEDLFTDTIRVEATVQGNSSLDRSLTLANGADLDESPQQCSLLSDDNQNGSDGQDSLDDQELELSSIENNNSEINEESPLEIEPIETDAERSTPHFRRASLKDYYLQEFDDETEGWTIPKEELAAGESITIFAMSWKRVVSFLAAMLFIFSVLLSLLYIRLSDYAVEEELHAAEAVADIVMALNFAHINHTVPQNQNWSDPDFLKHNLSAILSSAYEPLAAVDWHGQLQNASYILRIYTGSDLSHFLVIAQPNASVFQWLVPKAAIVVDSQEMSLRKTDDLKALNRLLINPTLDKDNSKSIGNIVQHLEVIPLSELQRVQENSGFGTPKALPLIRPGAENLIYNAIRYYHLSESMVKRAIALYESSEEHGDIAHFIEELIALEKYPNIVFYSAEGVKVAVQAQKAIATFAPGENFLFAYLQFNEKDKISSSHLLIDGSSNESKIEFIADADSDDEVPRGAPKGNYDDSLEKRLTATVRPIIFPSAEAPDFYKPFDNLLADLYSARKSALGNIVEELHAVVDDERRLSQELFLQRIHSLRYAYAETAKKYREQVMHAIALLAMSDYLAAVNDREERREGVNDSGSAEGDKDNFVSYSIDYSHPLYYKLLALAHKRTQLLNPIIDQIANLFSGERQLAEHQLLEDWERLEEEYAAAAEASRKEIGKEVAQLQGKYGMAVGQFMQYVSAAELDLYVDEEINDKNRLFEVGGKERGFDKIESEISILRINIGSATSLADLHLQIVEANKLLTMENISNPSMLRTLQNNMRLSVLQRLDFLILSPKSPWATQQGGDKGDKGVLEAILKLAWVSDREEYDYYLNEFQLL